MSTFINYVWSFVYDLFTTIQNTINDSNYDAFLDKQILSGDLLNVGLTWQELILYVSTWLLIIGFIYFIFKLVFGVIKLICLR